MKFSDFMDKIVVTTGLVLSVITMSSMAAGPITATQNKAIKIQPASSAATGSRPVFTDVRFEGLEIVTNEKGEHQWQAVFKNNSNNTAKNVQLKARVEGYRKEDVSAWQQMTIDEVAGGAVAYARGDLPSFEGMHLFRLRYGGKDISRELPAPFRKAEGPLGVEKVWVRKVGGKDRWYLKTKPNLYADIPAGKMYVAVFKRTRSSYDCITADLTEYTAGQETNKQVIRTGQSYTFSAELWDTPSAPPRYDYMHFKFGGDTWLKMDPSYYNPKNEKSWQYRCKPTGGRGFEQE